MARPTSIVCVRCGETKRVAPKGTIPRFCGLACSQAANLDERRRVTRVRLGSWRCVLCDGERVVAHGCQKYCGAACKQRGAKIHQYGITSAEYIARARAQGWACAICRSGGDRAFAVFGLCVDHCHDTGAIRGLLCRTCNTGIGHLRDDPVLVGAALTYLLEANTA